ncbi:PBS lyase HEAT-like repeat domain protein [Verrucomicrobiia bacterium DG1235]|nr:PBS lyase HEAT-like repeat domain protein [Verrucomicrobiae bacterium DG1235]
MNFLSKLSLKSITAVLALGIVPLGFSQIPEDDLESIFSRLNGDDFDARYAARMDLQDHVSKATEPGNDAQQSIVEAQLLERLDSEELLTTKLWLLRQLSSIGSSASLATLEKLQQSENAILADAARMATERNPDSQGFESQMATELSDDPRQLEKLAKNDPNRSVRSAAFSKLATKNPKIAADLLIQALSSEDNRSAPDFIRIAMKSSSARLYKTTLESLLESDASNQVAIIGALKSGPSSKIEKMLLRLLPTENTSLEIQIVDALGRVGSSKSLEALLPRISAKDRDLREAASDALARIDDPRIDRQLKRDTRNGDLEDRVKALEALSIRASSGVSELVNSLAADTSLDPDLREEAIAAMELVGNVESLPILVKIVIDEAESGLRRDAQRTLKRMTLRIADPDAAWAAFDAGFKASASDVDTQLALMLVSDSAPTEEAIEFLKEAWNGGDARIQKMVLRVLPTWRNWQGGFALLDLSDMAGDEAKLREQCFKGVGKLILGSDATFPIEGKFELSGVALKKARTPEERKAVITGFRYSTWRERVHVTYNDVDPELRDAVLEYAIN